MRKRFNIAVLSQAIPALVGSAVANPLVHGPDYVGYSVSTGNDTFPPLPDSLILLQSYVDINYPPFGRFQPFREGIACVSSMRQEGFAPETESSKGFTDPDGTFEGFFGSGDGSTTGGFKDLQIVGQHGAEWSGSTSNDSRFASISLALSNVFSSNKAFPFGAYSASLGYSSDISVGGWISGLPTDRFNFEISNQSGQVQTFPSDNFTPDGFPPGPYGLRVKDSGLLEYQCGQGWSFGPLPVLDDSIRAHDVERGIGSAAATLTISRNESAGRWATLGDGLSGRAWAFLSQGDSLVVGGTFTEAGAQTVNRIARWDGQEWTGFGQGLNGGVLALTEYNGEIIAGGGFTRAVGDNATEVLRVARWDGTAWRPMGDGFDFRVNALAVHQGVLYAGGNFTSSGGIPMSRLARWDPAEQRWLSAGQFDGNIFALTSGFRGLVVGGEFSIVDGVPSRAAVIGQPGNWSPFASINGNVYALGWFEKIVRRFGTLTIETNLVVGGDFVSGQASNIGAISDQGLSNPNGGGMLVPLGQGLNGRVNSIFTFSPSSTVNPYPSGTVLIVGGEFTSADGKPASGVARCDLGYSRRYWSGFGDGVDDFVGAVSFFNDEVVITGEFTATGARPVNHLARWTLDPCSSCLGDTNGDAIVNFADLNAVLTGFGQVGQPGEIPADLNDDGAVNFTDLNIVLSQFGSACER